MNRSHCEMCFKPTNIMHFKILCPDCAKGKAPDPDWPTATCGECGYPDLLTANNWGDEVVGSVTIVDHFCREKGCRIRSDCPACPEFVRRPKEAPDA